MFKINIIQVHNLHKSYGEVKAVKNISFNVSEGSLFSFLGTNGAGKSTTINVLTTLLAKDGGNVTIGGFNLDTEPDKIRNLTGIVFQDNVLDNLLTVEENLFSRGALYDVKNLKSAVENVVKITDISELKHRKYGKLSGGQRRRVDIARALIHTPKILFLDEPTTGLDPKTRRDIWEMLRKLQQENGITIFLTTHYMEEAKDSDHVVIIGKGEIKAEGTPIELKTKYCTDILKLTLSNGEYIEHKLKRTTDALPIIAKYYAGEHNLPTDFAANQGEKHSLPTNFVANQGEKHNTPTDFAANQGEKHSLPTDFAANQGEKHGFSTDFAISQGEKPTIENIEIINGTLDDVFLNLTEENSL